MKEKYQEYKFEDFINDESFRAWVLDNQENERFFWENFQRNNPAQKANIRLAQAFLNNLKGEELSASADELDTITQKVISSRKENKWRVWQNPFLRIAASITALLGMALFTYHYLKNTDLETQLTQNLSISKFVETINATDKIQDVLLEDGSKIQLYPGSNIKYPSPFEEGKRTVFLKGKAFFDIAKNPEKPFWVHTEKLSTQVLGTSFMVNAYPGQKNAIVQVKTGKVSVYLPEDLKNIKENQNIVLSGIILTPNQQASVVEQEERLVKSIVEAPVLLVEPKQEAFVFDEKPLNEVLEVLSKSYGIIFTYDEKMIENCYLTANLEKESLYEKLNLICRITHSSYEVIDAQIIIYSKGCN